MTKNIREISCSYRTLWPWERFKKEFLEDCPHCTPEEWTLALALGANVKPLRIESQVPLAQGYWYSRSI